MNNWPDLNEVDVPVARAEFEDLLALWRNWHAGRSSNLIKLGLRLDSAYESLTLGKQREFCRLLVAEGELDDVLNHALKLFNGSLKRLTYVRIDKTAAGSA